MILINNKQIYSDENKLIHRIGTETYFKRCMALPTDTVENFEEVDEIPAFTKSQYDEKVAELIRKKYSESEEFAIQRKMINASNSELSQSDEEKSKAIREYDIYNSFVEDCKIEAKNPDLYKMNF